MSARSFVDTNILVYTDDRGDRRKQHRAIDLISQLRLDGTGVVSTQVLQEYFVAVTRKLGVPAETARRKVEFFSRLSLLEIQITTVLGAIDLHRLNQLSFWDALILQAARVTGCQTLITEDLQDGQVIAGIKIRNPFVENSE